jgi:Arc/MetJ family transcription regulator
MVSMSRTNIDIDDELIASVMEQYHLPTKREAVDFALRKVARRKATLEEALAMEGIGWAGDLDEMRDAQAEKIEKAWRGEWA